MSTPSVRSEIFGERYRCDRVLGRGGSGQVWEAHDLLTRTTVAIKLFDAGTQVSVLRARQEIIALRLLRVPGVVRILDTGIRGDQPYLVMEKIDGNPFPGSRAAVPWDELAPTVVAMLEILATVHAMGVVHRDLKPANVLVDASGRPTLLDFGLAQVHVAARMRNTTEGMIVGTPAYLAPEQIRGNEATPAADLYAVGLMVYEALTGALPDPTDDLQTMLRNRLVGWTHPIRERLSGVPASVATLIDQLLRPDPDERPRSARSALAALAGASAGEWRFPWLGSTAPIDDIVNHLVACTNVDVVGPRGAGKSRVIAEVAERLAGVRRTAVVPPGARAFASLERAFPGAVDGRGSLSNARDEFERRVRMFFEADGVLLADDWEALDPCSREVILRARRSVGAMVRGVRKAHATRPPTVAVRPPTLSIEDLRAVFAGPDRLVHVREDAARVLREGTAGLPGRIVARANLWTRAGWARWDGSRMTIARDVLDAIDAGIQRAMDNADAGDADVARHGVPAHLVDLMGWIALAGARADERTIAIASGDPLWRVEAEVGRLVDLSLVEVTSEGVLRGKSLSLARPAWSASRRREAHRALASAIPPGVDERLVHLVAALPPGDQLPLGALREIVDEAYHWCGRLAREGKLGQASVVAALIVSLAREAQAGEEPDLVPLLGLWTAVAIEDAAPGALDRVAYAVQSLASGPNQSHILSLLRAAIAVGAWTTMALDLANAVPRFANEELEWARQRVRVLAARRTSVALEQAVVDDIAASARPDEALLRGSLPAWEGRLEYRRGDYAAAARLQGIAADTERWASSRIVAQTSAASALMECGDLAEARPWADAASRAAKRCRLPYLEGRAAWILRSIDYRLEVTREPDLELVEACAGVGRVELEAQVCLTEGAIAWRAGQNEIACELAGRAYGIWTRSGEQLGVLLAGGLMVASGAQMEPVDVHDLVQRALACPAHDVAVQVLALATRGRSPVGVPRALWAPLVRSLRLTRPGARQDVLSMAEAVDALAAARE